MTRPGLHAWRAGGLLVATVISTTAAVVQQPAGTSPGSNTVSGTIVEGPDRVPAAFVDVQIATGTSFAAGTRYSTRSGEDGTFTFQAVRAGDYFLVAHKPAYAPAYYDGRASTSVAPGRAFRVRDGQHVDGLELRIVRGGVITGRVVDQYGQPAVGANLGLRRVPASPGIESPFYVSSPSDMYRTNAEGIYRLYGLAEGEYVIYATRDGPEDVRVGSNEGPQLRFAPVYFPDTTDSTQATPIAVTPSSERAGVDLKLRLVPQLTIEGSLSAPAGIEVFSMQLRPPRPNLSAGGYPFVNVFIDRRFKAWVQPGMYTLTVYARQAAAPGDPPGTVRPLLWDSLDVRVTDRNVSGLVLALRPAMTVSGQLVAETLGAPVDWTQFAVSLINVQGRDAIFPSPRLGRATGDGHFAVEDVTPGHYRLSVRNASGIVPISTATVAGQAVVNAEIEISAGMTISDLVIRIGK